MVALTLRAQINEPGYPLSPCSATQTAFTRFACSEPSGPRRFTRIAVSEGVIALTHVSRVLEYQSASSRYLFGSLAGDGLAKADANSADRYGDGGCCMWSYQASNFFVVSRCSCRVTRDLSQPGTDLYIPSRERRRRLPAKADIERVLQSCNALTAG